jgi:cell division protein FtsB
MSLKAYVVSDSNDSVVITNMTELEAKDAKIKALEDEVYKLKTHIKSLNSELDKAERKAYTGLGD